MEFRDTTTSSAPFFGAYDPINVANPVYSGAPGDLAAPYELRDNDCRTRSLFVQQNLSLDDRFIATVGLRHDWLDIRQTLNGVRDSDDFSETSVCGALTCKITPRISTYASHVEFVAPPGIGVEPERGEQYELGVKYQPLGSDALISASVYDLTKNNVTVAVGQPDGNITRDLVANSGCAGSIWKARRNWQAILM